MRTRNRKTYVLTEIGDRKIIDALKKQEVQPRNRARWLAEKAEKSGNALSDDTIRKILSKQGVEENSIKYLFGALGLQSKVGVDWELVKISDKPDQLTCKDDEINSNFIGRNNGTGSAR